EKLSIRNLRRVVDNLHRLGMARFACTYNFIFGGLGLAARVARGSADYALHVLKYGLNPPEASAGDDRRLLSLGIGEGLVHGWVRDGDSRPIARTAGDYTREQQSQ